MALIFIGFENWVSIKENPGLCNDRVSKNGSDRSLFAFKHVLNDFFHEY